MRIERLPIDHPDSERLVEAVQAEYVVRYGGRDDTPIDPSMFLAPRGAFFIGYLDDRPVASDAWKLLEEVPEGAVGSLAVEVKRMYVAPDHRRAGVARRMLAHLEATAAERGADVIVLETGSAQPEAIAMYQAAGYQRIPPFAFYKDSPMVRCFARSLG